MAVQNQTTVATNKAKLFAYVSHADKADLERLAEIRLRSLSNLIEAIVRDEIKKAKESGELPDE